MPELPEVETIRRDLESELIGLKFTRVKLLWPGSLKDIAIKDFESIIIGPKIVAVHRRAKNLAIELSNKYFILMHMKMTGHLLIESSDLEVDPSGKWKDASGNLKDPINQFVRVIFWLDNGKIMAFSDLRKFGYIKLVTKDQLEKSFGTYGPEPFSKDFSINFLQTLFASKKQPIKKVLMDQTNIAGIGNIYADEILWEAKVHPGTPANLLTKDDADLLHGIIVDVLAKAVKLRGTSTSDYRDTKGQKGSYESELKAYRRTGLPCPRCKTPIKRISLGGRGTHFCPNCQRSEKS